MSAPTPSDIERCIQAIGMDIFEAYTRNKFPEHILLLNYYTLSNASDWVDLKDFMKFSAPLLSNQSSVNSNTPRMPSSTVHPKSQSGSITSSPFPTPLADRRIKIEPSDINPFLYPGTPPTRSLVAQFHTAFDPSPAQKGNSSSSSRSAQRRVPEGDVIEIFDSEDSDIPRKFTATDARAIKAPQKPVKSEKKRQRDPSPGTTESGLEELVIKKNRKKCKKQSKKSTSSKRSAAASDNSDSSVSESEAGVRITRQLMVQSLKNIDKLPSTWTVLKNGAWFLDLTNDSRDWVDKNGGLLSMAAIIKSQASDQDSWGGGTGGSIQPRNCPKVIPLDNVKCQLSEHHCQGIYHCSELDMTLIDGHERYVPDENEMKNLFRAERDVNIGETETVENRAASFYLACMKKKCPAKITTGENPEGVPCEGEAVYRKYKTKDYDGKKGFVGCSGWVHEKTNTHRFEPIPRDIKEELIIELFKNDGIFKNTDITSAECARVLHPRHGGRGQRMCPYTHIKDGKPTQGKLIHRPCPTKIKIYSPMDRSDHRAIVIFENPHNHPCFPSTKLSRDGKDMYEQAVEAHGVSRSTVLKCDTASSTKRIFDGKSLASTDPALCVARNKRKVIHGLKSKTNPHGNGLEAVVFQMRKDDKDLPPEKRYIHEIGTRDGIDIIVTMLPGLVERIHSTNATLHDNTYKRVFGEWKEWEVVIWDKRLNTRITVARIYSNHETRVSFERVWSAFWDTVFRVTEKRVQFKFIDGNGLSAIVVDGSKPQANGLGDSLIKQLALRGTSHQFTESDPQKIVQYILRTCDIHLERKFDNLAQTLPLDVMQRVRGFPFLETQEEVDAFVKWCEGSDHKVLRDWMIDKKSCPWFIPSVNRFMSKIPEEDWYLTPGHTNLNESAHPLTNMHTGTGLPISDAIKEARILDWSTLEKLRDVEANCVLLNSHNTQSERDRANRNRQESRARARTKRKETVDELQSIRENIQELTQISKETSKRKKELQEQQKAIQEANGLKRSPQKQNARGKSRLPHPSNIQDTNESSSLPQAQGPQQPLSKMTGVTFSEPEQSPVLEYPPSQSSGTTSTNGPLSTDMSNMADPHFGDDITNSQPVPSSSKPSTSQLSSYTPVAYYHPPPTAYGSSQNYHNIHTTGYYPQSYWQYPQPMYTYYIPPAHVTSTSTTHPSEPSASQPPQ